MPNLILNLTPTHWVKLQTLQEFVNNLRAPCSVVALVKGIAINCERRLAGNTEMAHKSMFNYGF